MQAGVGVVEPPVGGQGLDQVVLALVGGHLAHEQEVGTAPGPLSGQPGGQRRVGRPGEVHRVDQQGHRGRRPVAGVAQLALVEAGVGDGELGHRGQVAELGPPPSDLLADGREPRLEQVGRGDVVVVHELPLGALPEDVGHTAADGQLVEQDPSPPSAGRRSGSPDSPRPGGPGVALP